MIRNIRKNGEVIEDLTGFIVKETEAPEIYQLIRNKIEGEEDEEKKQHKEQDSENNHDNRSHRGAGFSMLP